jgi:hypothetical protein
VIPTTPGSGSASAAPTKFHVTARVVFYSAIHPLARIFLNVNPFTGHVNKKIAAFIRLTSCHGYVVIFMLF